MEIENILKLYIFNASLLRREFANTFSISDRMDVAFVNIKAGIVTFFGSEVKYLIHGTGVTFYICGDLEIDIEDNIHQEFFLSYWSFYNFCLNFDASSSFEEAKEFIKAIRNRYEVESENEKGILINISICGD